MNTGEHIDSIMLKVEINENDFYPIVIVGTIFTLKVQDQSFTRKHLMLS